MRIATHTASASVGRTLESLIAASGHHLATGDSADLVLVDTLHPAAGARPCGPALMLADAAATEALPADDTALHCPLRPERLLQRLLMLTSTQRLTLGQGWSLDMSARLLHHAQAPATNLTEKECALLKHLLHAHPAPLSRADLLEQVWGLAHAVDTHTLETHIYRLRGKLAALTPTPCDILTQDGSYVLALDAGTR